MSYYREKLLTYHGKSIELRAQGAHDQQFLNIVIIFFNQVLATGSVYYAMIYKKIKYTLGPSDQTRASFFSRASSSNSRWS